ncbi:MAG TPA: hypothetical protein VGO47_00715 [Chlamydiales bacterium]|nr:hypothetical protein [Chlamydiales bacterium]
MGIQKSLAIRTCEISKILDKERDTVPHLRKKGIGGYVFFLCGSTMFSYELLEYSDAKSSGYLQDFKVTDHACEKPVILTKSLLALRRLAEDITDVSLHLR